jgi:hypothetical protein
MFSSRQKVTSMLWPYDNTYVEDDFIIQQMITSSVYDNVIISPDDDDNINVIIQPYHLKDNSDIIT